MTASVCPSEALGTNADCCDGNNGLVDEKTMSPKKSSSLRTAPASLAIWTISSTKSLPMSQQSTSVPSTSFGDSLDELRLPQAFDAHSTMSWRVGAISLKAPLERSWFLTLCRRCDIQLERKEALKGFIQATSVG
ncbi:hypothetical protein LEN26_006199 [Aphanomyces euteiches]|nr:hypothetical protein LEN26_006199 [Aphanomyces euteiches]